MWTPSITLSAENMIQIDVVVSEIWPVNFKIGGTLFKQVHLFSKIWYVVSLYVRTCGNGVAFHGPLAP